jgi:hypothetical protein
MLIITTISFDSYAQINPPTQQTNQTQANQTVEPTNQRSSQEQLNTTELLNATNAAIIALNEDGSEQAQQILSQMQQHLLNATGEEALAVTSAVMDRADDEGGEEENTDTDSTEDTDEDEQDIDETAVPTFF